MSCLAVAAALAAPGRAQDRAPVTELFSEGPWRVEFSELDGEPVSCTLTGVVATGERLKVERLHQSGALMVGLGHPDWDLAEREERVALDMSGRQWSPSAFLNSTSISFLLGYGDEPEVFLDELARGSRLVLGNDEGEQVLVMSLDGSRAAVQALNDCREAALATSADDPADPF